MGTSLKQISLSAVAVAVLMIASCKQSAKPSESSQSVPETAATTELVTAKTAFWPMYKSAMEWSNDVQVLHLTQKEVPGFKNQAGKAAMWDVTFASPSKHQYRVYTYAIVNRLPAIHKGAAAGNPQPWSGQTRDAMPIDVAVFNTDSDAAYQTSEAAAASWLAKNPDKALTSLELGSNYEFKSPVWYIAWGDKKSGYICLVNATSGTLYKSKKS